MFSHVMRSCVEMILAYIYALYSGPIRKRCWCWRKNYLMVARRECRNM